MNKTLLKELKDGTCALILGPEFHLMGSEHGSVCVQDYLYSIDSLRPMPYLEEDGLFYFRSKGADDRFTHSKKIIYEIQEHFQKYAEPNDNYLRLARLPFYFILSLSPDEIMKRAFDVIAKPYDYRYFAKGNYHNAKGELDQIETIPTKEKPLIFNLLGSYTNWESMVFTYDSFFDFLFHVFALENVSQKLRTTINKASSFLLLGFKYDKWYLRLIFFLLKRIRGDKGIENIAVYPADKKFSKLRNFYTDEMAFKFNKTEVTQAIEELYTEARANDLLYRAPPQDVLGQRAIKTEILLFSAGPQTRTSTNFDGLSSKVEEEFRKSEDRNSFNILPPVVATTQKDFFNRLEKHCPHLIMICAHGDKQNNLLFLNDDGSEHPFSLEDFETDIRNHVNTNPRANLKYIIFNCCNSRQFAERMMAIIDGAIGMNGLFGVDDSIEFAQGFFNSFFRDRDFERAYDNGTRYLKIEKSKYAGTPALFVKDRSIATQ